AEIQKLAQRNDNQLPMKNWGQDILFWVSDINKGYHAFFAKDGTISEIRQYTTINDEEIEKAHVILEGSVKSWLALLRGEMRPTRAIVTRKIKGKKGSLTEIMPFTKILGK
ncbi:MAG: SCP2 sterol-binding domain-containing protein, partial [Candidatus Hodarchaeota archaeon]